MIGIYKITNLLNGKCYIGQSIHIERRWAEHLLPSADSIIANAIKKYGKENFKFEVIEEVSLEEIDTLDDLEELHIMLNNSIVPNGYNIDERCNGNHTIFIKINKEQYNEIVDLIQNSSLTFEEIAKKYSLNKRTITRINQGQTHKIYGLNYPLRNTLIKPAQEYFCVDCRQKISKGAIRCTECHRKNSRFCERPNREELKQLIRTMPFTKIGEKFGVSDNAIRKWCDSVNLPRKTSEIKKYSDEEWNLI